MLKCKEKIKGKRENKRKRLSIRKRREVQGHTIHLMTIQKKMGAKMKTGNQKNPIRKNPEENM